MLKRLVKLEVEVRLPELAILRRSRPSDRLYDLPDLLQISLPQLAIVEKVNIHQLVDHFDHAAVHIAELTILCNQICRLGLHLLVVLLDFNRIRPGDHAVVNTARPLGVLDEMFKFCRLVNHHRLLTVDHLRAHRVEEVGSLLQGQALLVELLSLLSNGMKLTRNLEAKLTQNPCILHKRDELL